MPVSPREGIGKDAIAPNVVALPSLDASVTVLNDDNASKQLLSASSTLPARRSLKREVSNMSDAEVATSAVRLTMRRMRGKQRMPDAFVTVAPLPVKVGESAVSFLPPNFKPTDGEFFFLELYHKHGIEVLKCRLVDRNKMRTMIRAAFLINHRAYCETFLTSKRCPQSINKSSRCLASKLSLCADRLFSELSHLQRVELFRNMLIRCQEQKLDDTLLDILTFLYKRDYRIACIESDDSKYWLSTKHALLTYNGKWGIIDHSCYKGKGPNMHKQIYSACDIS